MIKYPKTSPVGVDKFILRCQTLQQSQFASVFGVSESTLLFYGRADSVNSKDVIYVSGKDYKPIGFSDRYNFISYFKINNSEFNNEKEVVDVDFYCHGNLKNIYSSISHRADQELRLYCRKFIQLLVEDGNLSSIEIFEKAQPFHSFKINFKIVF